MPLGTSLGLTLGSDSPTPISGDAGGGGGPVDPPEPGIYIYFQPDGTSLYLRPDAISKYFQPL